MNAPIEVIAILPEEFIPLLEARMILVNDFLRIAH